MWRSEACKTFWLIQHPAAGSGQPENQEFFMGRSSPLSSPTSDMHSWKRWTKLKLICYIRDTSYELGIQVMIANQFLSCFRRVWPDMLISCIEQNQSMKEHEIIELWTPVFGQVLTFKMYMQVFLKSAWKYKSTYWFLLCSTKRRCCSFSMSADTGSKSTWIEKIDSSRICCWRPVFRTVW